MASLSYQKLLAFAESNDQKINNNKVKPITKSLTGPDPKAIQSFLNKKQNYEKKKLEEERLKRERLLFLRSQNSKSSKAAKMMATRTKDNDYSKIVLTDKDLQIKELLESDLKNKKIDDKLVRMKNRIEKAHELEGDTTQVIKKKKTNLSSKNHNDYKFDHDKLRKQKEEYLKKPIENKSKSKAVANPVKFEDLLKLANEKQKDKCKKTLLEEIEEVIVLKKNSNNENPEERKLREEYYQKISNKKKYTKNINKTNKKIEAHPSPSKCDIKYKEERNQERKDERLDFRRQALVNQKNSKELNRFKKENKDEANFLSSILKSNDITTSIGNLSKEQFRKLSEALAKSRFAQEKSSNKKQPVEDEHLFKHPNKLEKPKLIKTNKSNELMATPKLKKLDYNERLDSKSKNFQNKLIDVDSLTEEELEEIKKKRLEKQKILEREKQLEKLNKFKTNIKSKPLSMSQDLTVSKPNYNLPPIGATYKRDDFKQYNSYNYDNYEDDYYEENEEEEDDMDDFIDDGDDARAQSEEVSRCIREVFKYDKRKYAFDSDDDIEETSYAQQLKEERYSAKLGLLEDLDDIRKEKEEKRKKLLKKKGISFIDSNEDD